MKTTTGHELTVNDLILEISGDIDTMDQIPESEIEAACAEAGVRCTWEPMSSTSYRCERT